MTLCIFMTTSEGFDGLSRLWGGAKKAGSTGKRAIKTVTLDAPVAIGGAVAGAPGRFFNKMEQIGTDTIVPKLDRTRINISNTIDSGAGNVGSAYGNVKNSLGGTYGGVTSGLNTGVRGLIEDKYENPIIGGGKLLLSPIDRTIRGGAAVGDTILTTSGGFAKDLTKSVITTPMKAASSLLTNVVNPGYGFIADVSDATIVPTGKLVGGAYETVYGLGDKYVDDKILVPTFNSVDNVVTPLLSDADDGVDYLIGGAKNLAGDVREGTNEKIGWWKEFAGFGGNSDESEPEPYGGGGGDF